MMFGYIISGQVPSTSFERVSETQFLSNLTVRFCDIIGGSLVVALPPIKLSLFKYLPVI